MVKLTIFCSAILLFVLFHLPINVQASQDAKPATAAHGKVTAETLSKATKLYQMDCALCHGDNGNGQTDLAKSMNLKLDDWTNANTLTGKTDEELFDRIRKGKSQMPAEDMGRATDEVVWGLIAHIRKMPAHAAGEAGKSAGN